MNAPDLVNHERWHQTTHSGHEHTQNAIKSILAADPQRPILNCAQSEIVARNLTEFTLPAGLDYDRCLRAGSSGNVPECLRSWKYQPRIQAVPQLPSLQPLPARHKTLRRLPWFDCASPTRHLASNARHIRFNHDLWRELKPRTLRDLSTTLVLAMSQIGVALTSHIDLKSSFLYLGALARGLGAVQLFPARYLFPDARLGELADTPAPIFADLLPATCGYAWPLVDLGLI